MYRYLPYYLIGFVFLFNLGLYFTHLMMPIHKFFDSDGIYLPTLYRDLFVNGGSYTDWYGSAAPYYFPDMFLYFISNLIFNDFYYAIALYFTFVSMIIILTLYKIYKHFFSHRDGLYLSAISFSVIYLIPFDTYIFQFISVFHFGEFVIGLISIYLMLEILRNTQNTRYAIGLFILSVFTIASDSIYVLHFTLPTLATVLILWFSKILNIKLLLYIFVILVSTIIFGKLLASLVTFNYSDYSNITTLSFNHFQINIQSIIDIFIHSYTNHKFITSLMFIVYFTVILLFMFYKRVNKLKINDDESSRIFYLLLFLLFMFLGNILAVSLLYPHTIYIHYMTPIFLMPIFMLPIIYKWTKFNLNQKLFKQVNFILVVSLILILLFQSYKQFNNATIKTEYYPPLVSCVDIFIEETGAKHGISGYWGSKSITMLSKNNLNIVQLNYNLTKYKAVNSIAWYRDSYDFALIKNNAIDKKKLLRLNGNPSKTYKCKDSEILYYEDKLITVFKTL